MSARLIASILGVSLFSSACGPSDSDFSEFSTFESPDGSYYVIIDSAHSKLAFGPETIRAYVVAKDKRVRNHVVTTKIANDGVKITASNVTPNWIKSNVIQFCLSGVEQEDIVLEINLETLLHSETKINCS